MVVLPVNATDWQFEDEAPVLVSEEAEIEHGTLYESLIEAGGGIHCRNLRTTDSGLCLAGRSAGMSVTKEAFDRIRFKVDDQLASLSSLLSVQGWGKPTASRMTFYNTRTEVRDRNAGAPILAVADGHSAFLDLTDLSTFLDSDIIAVTPKDLGRDDLESMGEKIASLEQWYLAEPLTSRFPLLKPPPGMEVLLLARRLT
jgi:hypothetical protein